MFPPSLQQTPLQGVFIPANSTINSIWCYSWVYLQDITLGQQLPPKIHQVMKHATLTTGCPLITIILYFIIFLPNACTYPVQLHHLTLFLNNLMLPCIYAGKSVTSQQAPKAASVTHAVLPHASLFPFLLGTPHYSQLQERDQDCLGTIYDTPSEIML